MKKILTLCFAVLALVSLLLLVSCGDDPEPCTEHIDNDSDGLCDVCQTVVEKQGCLIHIDADFNNLCDDCGAIIVEKELIAFKIYLKDENGAGVSGAQVSLKKNQDTLFTAVTDADGMVGGELEAETYTLSIEGLPKNWFCESNYSEIELSENSKELELTVIDNTPNGSEEKPFPAENAETGETPSIVFPAGAIYHFSTRGSARYLIIENANASVIYKGETYEAKDGVVRVYIEAAADTNTATLFQVKNNLDTENEIKITFEVKKGSSANPYEAKLNESTVADLSELGTVYYVYTAEKDGILSVKSLNNVNSIQLYNVTSYVVAGYTEGRAAEYINVSEGDEIKITVTAVADSKENSIEFELSIVDGTESDPIKLYDRCTLKLLKSRSYYFEYVGEENTFAVTSETLNFILNGEALVGDYGEYMITLKNGDVLTVENPTEYTVSMSLAYNTAYTGSDITAPTQGNGSLYYHWTASMDGYLMVFSKTEGSVILIENEAKGISITLEGVGNACIPVSEYDNVRFVLENSEADTVFMLSTYEQGEAIPLEKTTVIALSEGEEIALVVLSEEVQLSIDSEDITVKKGEEEVSSDGGYSFTAQKNDTVTVTSTKDESILITVTVE